MKLGTLVSSFLLGGLLGSVPDAAWTQTVQTSACTGTDVLVRERSAGTWRGTPSRGWHGIAYGGEWVVENGMPKLVGHIAVRRVFCGSPAHRAGIRAGDLILSVNGRDPGEPGAMAATRPGLRFAVRLRRGSTILDIVFVSVQRPPELMV